ncbi:5000_t:CDS:1, partial [Racocetra persica]
KRKKKKEVLEKQERVQNIDIDTQNTPPNTDKRKEVLEIRRRNRRNK